MINSDDLSLFAIADSDFINEFERLIDERDAEINIGQLGAWNFDNLMIAARDALRTTIFKSDNCRGISKTPTGLGNLTFDEHRQYIGLANIEIHRFKAIPDKAYMADLLTIAVNSLYESINTCSEVNSSVIPDRWIPVSERMPIEFEAVIAFDGDQVYGEAMYSSDDGFTIDGYDPCDRVQLQNVTHWMPLPSAPQEVKGD
ncbi:DUF551 domain-containing protein [Klebsiella pneumoniae]|nr:DUF551 domain-containing protein [Klebsiella pneumoniae]